MHQSPALFAIRTFGGVRVLARAIGRSPANVSRWHQPKERGGHGGKIPTSMMAKILKVAQKLELDLTAEDLILGRSVSGR
jgi:hypothetical protein